MKRKHAYSCIVAICLLSSAGTVHASDFIVTASVILEEDHPNHDQAEAGVVAWLEPLDHPDQPTPTTSSASNRFRLTQQDRTFEPHLMVVPVGSSIEFPNRDYLFHNVFSMFNGKRFDLGLYEAGTSRRVHFDKEGVSYIFCNIHPEMSAVVVALKTPYFAIQDRDGTLTISGVPAGRYRLKMWIEGASNEEIANVTQELSVNGNVSLGIVRMKISPEVNLKHLNKYGMEYDSVDSGYRGH